MALTIRIGTRGSALALWQANWVKDALESANEGLVAELVIIKTRGDKILDVPLAKVGGKGLFVKEIEEALLAGGVDLAVHSMKDMPAKLPEGLWIGAMPVRENPGDVLVCNGHGGLEHLPRGARIGTSSLRRAAQLLHVRPDLAIVPLRGNLDTRLKKLETEGLDAVVLAAAGMIRLGYGDRITEFLDHGAVLPAVAQGALGVECRVGDNVIQPLLDGLEDPVTRIVVTGERAFLARLEGGCQVPVAAHGTLDGDFLSMTGIVAGVDGAPYYRDSVRGPAREAGRLGVELAEKLLAAGGQKVLDELIER
ncbi:MAG: hydroxymethylbilane synthase [Desulfatibacillaceae bacterium]